MLSSGWSVGCCGISGTVEPKKDFNICGCTRLTEKGEWGIVVVVRVVGASRESE